MVYGTCKDKPKVLVGEKNSSIEIMRLAITLPVSSAAKVNRKIGVSGFLKKMQLLLFLLNMQINA